MTKTPIEALEDFDFTVNTHKNATMKKVVWNSSHPLIRAKTNYAKEKYKCETLFQTAKYIGYKDSTERLRSTIASLKRDD